MEHDDNRFFGGASRGDYLDALTAHAGLGSVVALEGDSGSGVSTLLGHAVMALLGDMEIVRIDGAAEHHANVVIESLLRHFDIARAELPGKLREALMDGRLLVVIDNSEDLLDEAVATMAALKQKLGGRLGYQFGGLPGTAEKLKGADLVLDDVLDLPSLTADDVQDFAWFVLGQELDEQDAERFQHNSDGNIAHLLELLRSENVGDPAVISASVEEGPEPEASLPFAAPLVDDDDGEDQEGVPPYSSSVNAEDGDEEDDEGEQGGALTPPWRHVAAAVGLLLVVVILWSVFSGGDSEPADQEGLTHQLALPVPQQPGSDGSSVDQGDEQAIHPMVPTMEPVERLEDLQARRSSGSDEEPEADNVFLTPVTDPVMQSAPAAEERGLSVAEEPANAQAQPESRSDAPAEEAEPRRDQSQVATEDEGEPGTVPASEPLLTGLDAELGYQQEDWLATLDDSRWFLQITVTSQEANARGVLDLLERKGAYYRAERNGKAVYLVLSGDYSSRQAALDAKSTLPAKLRSAGPFPRKMADIRREL